MNATAVFIKKFHSLEGPTVGERRRNFFKLLKDNESDIRDGNNLVQLLQNLRPQTYLETIFHLELLIYFRQTAQLLQLLEEGNDVIVSKILHQDWFITTAFNDVHSEVLVTNILPRMSYVVRVKLLKKLARFIGEDRFDAIYDLIVLRYGKFFASKFLTGCSSEKIRSIFRESQFEIELNVTELERLYYKDATLVDFYLGLPGIYACNYLSFIKRILHVDKDLYWFLVDKYKVQVELGYRATKKYVSLKRENVIEHPDDFMTQLNKKAIFRKLGKDTVKLFRNLLPANVTSYPSEVNHLRYVLAQKYHYSLFIKTIESHYDMKYQNYPDLITHDLLRMIPDKEERATLAKIKVDIGSDDFIKYLPCKESLQLLKQRINVTSDSNRRMFFLETLVKTCRLNDDFDALVGVMKYFLQRHKSEKPHVYLKFLHTIESTFGYKKFTEEMWKLLDEIITVHTLKHDLGEKMNEKIQTLPLNVFNRAISDGQKISYLKFKFDAGENIDKLLLDFFRETPNISWGTYDERFELYLIRFLINNSSECSLETADLISMVLKALPRLQAAYKSKITIYNFPDVTKQFDAVLNSEDTPPYVFLEWFKGEVCKTNRHEDCYVEYYFKLFRILGDANGLRWFLKFDPLTLSSNLNDNVLQYMITSAVSLLPTVKSMSHLELDRRLIDFCKQALTLENVETKSKYVKPLAILMRAEDFAQLASKYKPDEKRLNLEDESSVRLYKIQCAFASAFKYTKSPEVFSSLRLFCVGDYFHSTRPSLYSIFYRTGENSLETYFSFLMSQPLSVKKHALHLANELSTFDIYKDKLRALAESNGNQLGNVIFTSVTKRFRRDPCDATFELWMANMKFLNKNDEASIVRVINFQRGLPIIYTAKCMETIWIYFDDIVDQKEKLLGYKSRLLQQLDSDGVSYLTLDFVRNVLRIYFMNEDKYSHLPTVSNFAFLAWWHREDNETIAEDVFRMLDSKTSIPKILEVFNEWNDDIFCSKENREYLQVYIAYWEKRLDPVEFFEQHVDLFFLRAKSKFGSSNSDEFLASVADFIEKTLAQFGPFVMDILFNGIDQRLMDFCRIYNIQNKVYSHLIENHFSRAIAKFVLKMLSHSSDYKFVTNLLISIRDKTDDPGVKVSLYANFGRQYPDVLFSKDIVKTYGS